MSQFPVSCPMDLCPVTNKLGGSVSGMEKVQHLNNQKVSQTQKHKKNSKLQKATMQIPRAAHLTLDNKLGTPPGNCNPMPDPQHGNQKPFAAQFPYQEFVLCSNWFQNSSSRSGDTILSLDCWRFGQSGSISLAPAETNDLKLESYNSLSFSLYLSLSLSPSLYLSLSVSLLIFKPNTCMCFG